MQESVCSKERCYSLDFLKFVASILIVFHHFQQMTGVPFEKGINYFDGNFYWGYLVELFFVLSGYFMVNYIKPIFDGKLMFVQFYIKRAIRLLPLVAISAVFYELQLILYEHVAKQSYYGIQVSLFGILIDALGIQGDGWVFANPCVNNVTWYVSVLMLCYLTMYLVTWIASKLKTKEMYFYVGMIFLGFAISTYGWNAPFLNASTSRGYIAFYIGLLLSKYVKKYGIRFKNTIFSLGVICAFCVLWIWGRGYIAANISAVLCLLVYPSLVIVLQAKIFTKLFSHRIWGLLGKISFDIYIWHCPLLQLMFTGIIAFGWNINFADRKSMWIFALLSAVVGFVSHIFLEVPITKWLNKKSNIGIL